MVAEQARDGSDRRGDDRTADAGAGSVGHVHEGEPRRVYRNQRPVARVRIRVDGLAVGEVPDQRIGREEAAERRVVDPATHVDQADVVEHFMRREALPGGVGDAEPVGRRR